MTRAGVLLVISLVFSTNLATASSKEERTATQTMAKCLEPLAKSVASAKPTSDQIEVMRKALQEAIQQARSNFWTDDPKVGLDGARIAIEGMARAVEIASLGVNSDEWATAALQCVKLGCDVIKDHLGSASCLSAIDTLDRGMKLRELHRKPYPAIGMTTDEVRNSSSLGDPHLGGGEIHRTVTADHVDEWWYYPAFGRSLFFRAGVLVRMSD